MSHSSSDNSALLNELATVGKAFASAKRIQIMGALAQGERTVETLSRTLGIGLTTVSSHLQVLRASGLVKARREGTRVHYRLAGNDVAELLVAFRSVATHHSPNVERELAALFAAHRADEVEIVRRDELTELARSGAAILDVRPIEEFTAGHIPGALSLPLGELSGRLDELAGRPEVIAYCRGAHCVMAFDAVHILRGEGMQARRLEDGMTEWQMSGRPVEVGTS